MTFRNCMVGTLLNGVAANDTEANRTATIPLSKEFNRASFYVDYTYSAGTAVTMTLKELCEDGGSEYTRQSLDAVASPTLDSGDAVYSKTVTASGKWVWTVDLQGYAVKAIFAVTGGGADDKLTVKARVGVV